MSNPFLEAMNNQSMQQQLQALANVWKMSQAVSNPEKYLMDELTKSSNYGPILKLLQQNNGNLEQTVYDYAKELGKDPNQVVSYIKQMIGAK